jgi:putative phosphoesterase
LSGLPRHFLLSLDDLRIFVCHGSPRDLLNEYVYPDRGSYDNFVVVGADVIVLGHTHWPMLRRVGKTLIVNPGSCGQPRNGTAASGQLRYSGQANAKRGISSYLF